MVPVWMTLSDLFKVTIIQRQVTRKLYSIELYLKWPTNRKSCMVHQTAPFSMILNDPYPQFQAHAILWRWVPHKRYEIHTFFLNEILIGTYVLLNSHFEWLSEWLSKIFNDTKRRAVSCKKTTTIYEKYLPVWKDCPSQTRRQTELLNNDSIQHTRAITVYKLTSNNSFL